MKNYLNILKGELLKSFKGKTIIIMLVIVIGTIVAMSLIYGITVESYKGLFPEEEITEDILPEDVLAGVIIEFAENDLDYSNGLITKYQHDLLSYQYRSTMVQMNYMIKNDIAFSDYTLFQSSDMLYNATMQNFLVFSLSTAFMIIVIIASVLAAGAIHDEINNGTMRLIIICPVRRYNLILAKITAIMAQLLIVICVIIPVAIIMGLIMYPNESLDVMIVFNATGALVVPFFLAVMLQGALLMVSGLIIIVIIMAFTAIFRSKIFGIVIGVILSTNLIGAAIKPSMIRLFSYSIFTNMNFSGFFNFAGNNLGQLQLSMALLVYIINILVLLCISGLLFKVRDIN